MQRKRISNLLHRGNHTMKKIIYSVLECNTMMYRHGVHQDVLGFCYKGRGICSIDQCVNVNDTGLPLEI